MKHVLAYLIVFTFFGCANAQDLKVIQLDAPNKDRGSSIMKSLAERRSAREYAEQDLSLQDLSDLLWAANGISQESDGKRTAPSALNKQDIDIYVVMKEGAYLYDAKAHALHPITAGDHRAAVAAGQDFAKTAPVSLVLVSDLSRFGEVSDRTRLTGAMDAGYVSQNICLFCAGTGLATVPRATMDKAALKEILKLTDSQELMLNSPVGYPKN